jgi:hypothetical protein
MSGQTSPTNSANIRRVIIGAFIVAAAVIMLFWWGFHFRIFGSDIDWVKHPAQLGFVAWLVVGAFGAGYQVGGGRAGLKAMGWTTGLLVAAILAGVIRKYFAG